MTTNSWVYVQLIPTPTWLVSQQGIHGKNRRRQSFENDGLYLSSTVLTVVVHVNNDDDVMGHKCTLRAPVYREVAIRSRSPRGASDPSAQNPNQALILLNPLPRFYL